METPTHPKKNQSFSKEPMITQEFKEEERNEVWGNICFEELKEKNIEKKGRKRKRQRAENAIEKKAYRDKFYLVA